MCFLDLDISFPSRVREVFSYYIFTWVFLSLSLSFFSWDPYNVNVCMLKVVPEVSYMVLIFFILLSFFCSDSVIPVVRLPAHWSVPLYHLICYWFPLVYFLFQLLYFSSVFCSLYFLALLNTSNLLLYSSKLPLSSWIIFMIMTLNSLLVRLLIFISLNSSYEVLFLSLHLECISLSPHFA